MNITIFYVTFPNQEVALQFSKEILNKKFIACYNISKMKSGYWWEGQLQNEEEWVAIYKTTQLFKLSLEKHIKGIHPYDVPCIMRWEVEVNEAYGKWVEGVVNNPS